MASHKTLKREPFQKKVQDRIKNRDVLRDVFCDWLFPEDEYFADWQMHGNLQRKPEQLVAQAILFSWQGDKHLFDAFEFCYMVCADIGLTQVAKHYISMINALAGYRKKQINLPSAALRLCARPTSRSGRKNASRRDAEAQRIGWWMTNLNF